MKRYNLLMILLLMGLFLMASCADESIPKNEETIVEGIPVGLDLSITQETGVKITTRAVLDEETENKVYDIRLFVFNKQKKLEYTNLYTYEEPITDKKASVRIPTGDITTGEKYIYAIANTTGGIGQFLNKEGGKISDDGDWKKVATVSDLQAMVSSLSQNTEQRLGDHLLMSGTYSEGESLSADGSCRIAKGESEIVQLAGSIKLLHADSRITFEVSVSDQSITFIPKSWQVVNVPKRTSIFSQEKDCADIFYFSSAVKPFDNTTINGTNYEGGSFTFYMYENRKSTKLANDGSSIGNYEDRERQEKDAAGKNGDFKYAAPMATYVILTGDFSQVKGGKTYNASVSYKIHLGYVNEVVGDFKSKRNTIYKYKAKVAGVENIILEVESSNTGDYKENQPGAEGKVVIADQVVSVDAHYEVQNITFYKDALDNLSVSVSTPKGEGTYEIDVNGDLVENTILDFNWVKFVRVTDDKSRLASYPGDDATVTMDDRHQVQGDDGSHHLSINQLLWQLYNHKVIDNGLWTLDSKGRKYVVYTAFVDEYYYTDIALDKFVNVEDRKMHILCDTKYSKDEQSSLTTANIMISQRSIKSIYNFGSDSDVKTAWGIESVDETPGAPLKAAATTRNETLTNGRYNTFDMLGFLSNTNKDWSSYVDFTNPNKSKLYNKNAEYACLQRNRDLNGNGKIDANEIRWYLPALNQYTGLWIGKDALSPEARLFQKDPALITETGTDGGTNGNFRTNNHYMTSNGVRFWAEEGAATGNTMYDLNKSKFNIRCARNLNLRNTLEPGTPKLADDVDDYVKSSYSDKDNTVVSGIDLSRLAVAARRSTAETGSMASSAEHTGADLNRPYKAFEVKVAVNSKCPSGYRVPNQRELALIAGYTKKDVGTFTSCTYSDLTYKQGIENNKKWYTYYTSYWSGGMNIVTLNSKKAMGTIGRCVQDK